jgi:hypothetical protein
VIYITNMPSARICDIEVAIDIFLIRISIYMCLGPNKDGFLGAQNFVRKFPHETCVKWYLYRTELCQFYVMRTVYYRGADKSLARPGRKQATASKL